MTPEITYRDAGVDLDAARRHTDNIASLVAGGVGFAGLMELPRMRDPMIVGCTDGVGTKVALAQRLGRLDGLGQDLVAMCVNDLVCTGATPLFFLDYLAVGRLDPDVAGRIVGGIAAACRSVGCALLGGETAEHPGVVSDDHLDVAGFACGLVERDEVLGAHRIVEGDHIVGIASSGIHSNGFSLVRALVDSGALAPDPDLLLAPTRLYVSDLTLLRQEGVALHAAAHITGGGLPENLPRVFPDGLRPAIVADAWERHPAIAAILARSACPRTTHGRPSTWASECVSCCPRPTRPGGHPDRRRGADRARRARHGPAPWLSASPSRCSFRARDEPAGHHRPPPRAGGLARRDRAGGDLVADAQAVGRALRPASARRSSTVTTTRTARRAIVRSPTWSTRPTPALVVLAGWMSILTPSFLDRFPDRVINLHPSILPAFPGMHAIDEALAWGVRYTGVTVHFADPEVDGGPPVLQEPVP